MTAPHWYAPFKGVFAPLDKGPDEGPFLCVSFNVDYAPFIRGALAAMLQRQMWAGDDSAVDDMIMNVQQLLYLFGQLTACPIDTGPEGGYEVLTSLCESLRYENGKLQALCCGEWVDIPGQPPGSGEQQPGDGTTPPAPGHCQIYHASMLANGQWLLPAVVNTGDTLTFSNPRGAATDGSGSNIWYCPNGSIFFASVCTGIFGTDGADPLPTSAHMGVVVQIGGVWYDTQNPITVGPGVVNQPVIMQANDVSLTDNSGGYTFDVELCNGGASSRWGHTFNFLHGEEGWYVRPGEGDGWDSGAFQGTLTAFAYENYIVLEIAGIANIDRFGYNVNTEFANPPGVELRAFDGAGATGTPTTLYTQALAGGSTANQDHQFDVTPIVLPGGTLSLMVANIGSTLAAYDETRSITLGGPGADPF